MREGTFSKVPSLIMLLSDKCACFGQGVLEGCNVNVLDVTAVLASDGGGGAGGLAQGADDGQDTDGGLRLVGGGDTSACHQQVLCILGDQGAVRNGVILSLGEEVVGGTGAFGVVDIDVVVTCGDTILELDAILQFLGGEDMLTVDHTAFAHTGLGSRGNDLAVFKAGNVVPQEVVKLYHLLSGDHIRLGDLPAIGGVLLDDTGSVELYHAGNGSAEDHDLGHGVLDIALGVLSLPEGDDVVLFLAEHLVIHVTDLEAQGHGLAKLIPGSAQTEGEICQEGYVGISGTIDEVGSLQLHQAGFIGHGDRGNAVTLALDGGGNGVKEKLHAGFHHHAVEDDLQPLGVEGIVVHGTCFAEIVFDLGKDAAGQGDHFPCFGISGLVRHEGVDTHGAGGAAQSVDSLHQKSLGTVSCGGKSRAATGKTAAKDDHVVFSVAHRDSSDLW